MRLLIRTVVLAAPFLLTAMLDAQTPRNPEVLTQEGRRAYEASRFPEAVKDFEAAVALQPSTQRRQYLGVAYAALVDPFSADAASRSAAAKAAKQFQLILADDPGNLAALLQAADLAAITGRDSEALSLERSAEKVAPNNPEIPYTVGAFEWRQAYETTRSLLAEEGLRDDGGGTQRASPALCKRLRSANGAVVDDGIRELTRATQLRPHYGDAMSYLSLLLSLRADLDCEDKATLARDLQTAEQWARLASQARQATPEQGAIRKLSIDSPPLTPPPPPSAAPPPPPPPPRR